MGFFYQDRGCEAPGPWSAWERSSISVFAVRYSNDKDGQNIILDLIKHTITSDPDSPEIIGTLQFTRSLGAGVVLQKRKSIQYARLQGTFEAQKLLFGALFECDGELRHQDNPNFSLTSTKEVVVSSLRSR